MPRVVNLDWLINSLETGYPIENDTELVDYLLNAN